MPRPHRGRLAGLAVVLAVLPSVATAGEADVIDATARQAADGTWTITATVRHEDEGWVHFADAFEALAPDGTVLGVRTLAHPHVDEQPFTRSLTGVVIPAEIKSIRVRAHDNVHGYRGAELTVDLPR
ncbi:MAG: hypothetical protein RIM80_05800 [Alphaproteobacteria bacterium]